MFQLALKAFAVWCLILGAAIINGGLREAILIPQLGQSPALILSGIFLSVLIISISYFCIPWLSIPAPRKLFALGLAWVLLTLAFEFSFGLMQGKSLATLLQAYTFKDGNIWPLVLVITACAPYLAEKLRSFTKTK